MYAVALCNALNSKYDYKIQYEDISKLFLLEKPDDRYTAFVISLEKPIRQGQQKYQHLVLQVSLSFELHKLNLTFFRIYSYRMRIGCAAVQSHILIAIHLHLYMCEFGTSRTLSYMRHTIAYSASQMYVCVALRS
jgi:hypothetical protein